MNTELQKLKEQLDAMLCYVGTDSKEALLISQEIDLLINEYMYRYSPSVK